MYCTAPCGKRCDARDKAPENPKGSEFHMQKNCYLRFQKHADRQLLVVLSVNLVTAAARPVQHRIEDPER